MANVPRYIVVKRINSLMPLSIISTYEVKKGKDVIEYTMDLKNARKIAKPNDLILFASSYVTNMEIQNVLQQVELINGDTYSKFINIKSINK